jgi:endonuclease III
VLGVDLPFDPIDERLEDIVRLLDLQYGPRHFTPHGDVARQLVATMFSQSTSNANSRAAFTALLDTYATWDEAIEAPTSELAATIAAGGLANQKAPRIQAVLRALRELDEAGQDLRSMPTDEAMRWLTSLPGVGPHTAACVLLFALGHPIIPVDTSIARVMTRLGIVPDRTSTVTKQHILTELVGPDPATLYAVHVETIEHGRTICRSGTPRCGACMLQDLCDYYRQIEPV